MSLEKTPGEGRRTPAGRVRLAAVGVLGLVAVTLTGCSADTGLGEWSRVGLPPASTDRAVHIGNLWVGAWIASMAIGVLMWGLMGWVFVRYRRKHADEVPKQTRFNLPLELMYTVVPFLIIGVLFLYTVQVQNKVLERSNNPDQVVNVVGQKWSWTFNYMDTPDGTVWEAGTIEHAPTLYLPVNETVQFNLNSPDVIHSFWIPSFYFKLDVVPGRTNSFEVTPTQKGEFAGKCAELCGTYHSAMIFNVKIVDRSEFDAKMAELAERGNTGEIKGSIGENELAGSEKLAKKEGE